MNRLCSILREIIPSPSITQRELAEKLGLSLGLINSGLKSAGESGYIIRSGKGLTLTKTGMEYMNGFKVEAAVILAAGFGSRFVPLTYETPKGLLQVYDERMIERQIRQLHEAGICDISIVVGYLKEKFDYLIDKFGVKLLYNPEYASKNTLATLWHARKLLYGRNVYLLSSDNWLRENMYRSYEPHSWYSAAYMNGDTGEWCLKYNAKGLITGVEIGGSSSYAMYGPVYMSREFSDTFLPVLEKLYNIPGNEQSYWEQVYADWLGGKLPPEYGPCPDMYINIQPENQVYEFENLEELREFDEKYLHKSDNAAMELISKVFNVPEKNIVGISCLKSGMTNKSFLFSVCSPDSPDEKSSYIFRIPGQGTELLIDRAQEYESYKAVDGLDISENLIYFNPDTGYKISRYYPGSRNADSKSANDMERCMKLLSRLHSSGLGVKHEFNIEERIIFYESLCMKSGGILFEDYREIRCRMQELIDFLHSAERPKVLAHIDSVADNFIFTADGGLRLIDWEYSGMADPFIDVAMCAIYSYYNKEEVFELFSLYLGRSPESSELKILYAYMALGGFLWTLWAVYKENIGESFGDYTLIMYRYAKDYHKLVINN